MEFMMFALKLMMQKKTMDYAISKGADVV